MIRIAVCDDFKDTVNQVNGYLSETNSLGIESSILNLFSTQRICGNI